MSELSSKFSREDIETLLEAMNDWEAVSSQEWHLMNMIKSAPMPPEDHEAFDMVQHVKDYFRNREKDINDSRVTKQEKACFLKAKLMMVRRDLGINQLFEMATEDVPVDASAPKESAEATQPVSVSPSALERAEYFIRDMGIWEYYQKFLDRENGKEVE